MAKAVAGLLVAAALAGLSPVRAHGFHGAPRFGHAHRGHPINAWRGSRHRRLR